LAAECDALELEAQAGARLEVAGRARLVEARATARSEVWASQVSARTASAIAEGESLVHLQASEQVRGRAFGGSEVRVEGTAERDLDHGPRM
jgi:hypothetical protein